MLKVVAVDNTAEARGELISLLNRLTGYDESDIVPAPSISVKALSPEEIKFHGAPDILVIGPSVTISDITFVCQARKLMPNTSILVMVRSNSRSFSLIEDLARLGADDVITDGVTRDELLKSLVILSKKRKSSSHGKLIVVEGGKGGVGVTTVVAAMGEELSSLGKRVLIVDLDTDTQDLSRFLFARPFLNENLQLLLDQTRPINEDFVRQCVSQVWVDVENFSIMSPPTDIERVSSPGRSPSRILTSIFEVLDSIFDVVIVDIGGLKGSVARALYRLADDVVLLVGTDPAGVYASIEKSRGIRAAMSARGKLTLLENAHVSHGVSSKILRTEVIRSASLEASAFLESRIPFSAQGSRWPGSGLTFSSCCTQNVKAAVRNIVLELLGTPTDKAEKTVNWKERVRATLALPWLEARRSAATESASTEISDLKALPSPEKFEASEPSTRWNVEEVRSGETRQDNGMEELISRPTLA